MPKVEKLSFVWLSCGGEWIIEKRRGCAEKDVRIQLNNSEKAPRVKKKCHFSGKIV
jgi:hypothetical protein